MFEFLFNYENNPLWQVGMVAARFDQPGPVKIGARYTQVARFLGREIHSFFEVVAFEPGRLVRATTVESTFSITFTRIVKGDENKASVSAIIEGNPQRIFRLAEPLLAVMVRRSIEADYRRLKHLLEAPEKTR